MRIPAERMAFSDPLLPESLKEVRIRGLRAGDAVSVAVIKK
jgi:hypothetical protein